MKTLFNEPVGTDFDIKNTNFADFYPSVNPALSWKSIRAYVVDGVRDYILPHLGRTFYNDVVVFAESDTPDSGIKDEILDLLRSASAAYGIFLAMPHHNVIISDMGVQQSSNEKSRNASQWSFNTARWAALFKAEKALDQVLLYMYQNKANAFLTSWASGPEYKHYFTDFISGATEIAKFCNIKTMRGYWSILPYIKEYEGKLTKIIGPGTYADIKTKLASTDENEKELIRLIRYYLVSSAMYEALPDMTLFIEDGNIYSLSSSEIVSIGVNSEDNKTAIARVLDKAKTNSAHYENEIRNYLTIYKEVFTIWADECYQETRPKSIFYTEGCDGDAVGGVMI